MLESSFLGGILRLKPYISCMQIFRLLCLTGRLQTILFNLCMHILRIINYKSATHFISTSVYSGMDLTATQLEQSVCNPQSFWMHTGLDLRSNRLNLPKPLQINLVHLLKVLHIGEEDVHFDHFCKIRACGLEDGFQVPNALVLLYSVSKVIGRADGMMKHIQRGPGRCPRLSCPRSLLGAGQNKRRSHWQ